MVQRRSGPREAILPVVALGVALLGLMSAYQALFLGAPYPIPVTDFGRDLLGAHAAQVGVDPYQTLGALDSAMPDVTIPSDAADLWVAHSPLSVALARGWLAGIGPSHAEDAAKIVQGVSLMILLGWVWSVCARRWSGWHGLLFASATALTLGFRLDAFWIQGASLLALGLGLVFVLDGKGRRALALLLLGILVAWRPWIGPMAFVLPGSVSSVKDGARVFFVAAVTTFLVLPWVGGWESLSAWMFRALPANLDHYVLHGANRSLTGPVLPMIAAGTIYLAVVALLPSQRGRWTSDRWPVLGAAVILGFTVLVWPHYWLALMAVLISLTRLRSYQWALLTLLLLAWPLSQQTSAISNVTSYLAVLVLVVSLSARSIPGDDYQRSSFEPTSV